MQEQQGMVQTNMQAIAAMHCLSGWYLHKKPLHSRPDFLDE